MNARLSDLRERAHAHHRAGGLPLVTLSYAQSLDGCLTTRAGQPSPVSGPESLLMTHRLRAAHDAVLIGIGTALADNPRLTVRLTEGPDPRPVVVDSHLRLPASSRLLQQQPRVPWVATTDRAGPLRRDRLEAAGARLLILPSAADGRVDLRALVRHLGDLGIESVMVEGGAQIITSFLRIRLADQAVITVAPVLAGGYHAVGELGLAAWPELPRLRGVEYQQAGEDLLVWGDLVWGEPA